MTDREALRKELPPVDLGFVRGLHPSIGKLALRYKQARDAIASMDDTEGIEAARAAKAKLLQACSD